jgi:hypothetical protein
MHMLGEGQEKAYGRDFLTDWHIRVYIEIAVEFSIRGRMAKKKISTSIPEALLDEACRVSKLNQTDALIEGLKQLIRSIARKRALSLRGEIHFEKAKPARERVRL